MKTLLKLSFLAFAVLVGVKANAQSATSSTYGYNGDNKGLSYGIKAGINYSGFIGKDEALKGKSGTNVGFFIERTLPSNAYLYTGLDLSVKGAKSEIEISREECEVTFSPIYLQVPVHVGYKLALNDGISLGLHVGPYMAYGIGGKTKLKINNASVEYDFFDDKELDLDSKRLDLGIGSAIDLDIHKFRIGLGYDLGLTNVVGSMSNYSFFMNIGYRF